MRKRSMTFERHLRLINPLNGRTVMNQKEHPGIENLVSLVATAISRMNAGPGLRHSHMLVVPSFLQRSLDRLESQKHDTNPGTEGGVF